MPEGPECRIFTSQLNKAFANQSIQNIEIIGGRYLKEPISKFNQLIFPLTNTKFDCRGKFLYWQFDNTDEVFFITLGMAASFGPKSKHSAIKFTFEGGDIYWNDIRRFGTFKISDTIGLNKKLNSLGWDILQEPIPGDILTLTRKFKNKTVAELLMNQKISAGIGNYIKNEGCYRAKILPTRLVSSLSDNEILTLYQESKLVAIEAYTLGGATIKTFADMHGNTGKFFDKFQIYGKKTDPLGNPVTKILTRDGRSTFYVEGIQK